jgi:SAM-dependent methyltransferase
MRRNEGDICLYASAVMEKESSDGWRRAFRTQAPGQYPHGSIWGCRQDVYQDQDSRHIRCVLPRLPEARHGLLDCGCGEGTITVDLAALVAPGQVVGIDIAADTIQLARQLAADRGLTNVRFEVGSVYELPFADNSFDAVFSHALFEHLTDKPKALGEIRRVLKPGGFFGVRAPDSSARISEPPDPLIDQFWTLFDKIRDKLGGESKVGRRLCGLLHHTGFTQVRGSASFEWYGTPDSLLWFAELISRFAVDSPYATEWLARGWTERETLEQISAAWKGWAARPDAFAATAWCEAVGWKA